MSGKIFLIFGTGISLLLQQCTMIGIIGGAIKDAYQPKPQIPIEKVSELQPSDSLQIQLKTGEIVSGHFVKLDQVGKIEPDFNSSRIKTVQQKEIPVPRLNDTLTIKHSSQKKFTCTLQGLISNRSG